MQVWRIPLQAPPQALEHVGAWLDEVERKRSTAFRFERDRRRFVAAHGATRAILGQVIGCAPQAVAFVVPASGKPALADPAASGEALHFNLTHSGEVALLAVSPGREVGIDVECFDAGDGRALEVLTQFSPAEQQVLNALQGPDKVLAFYRCWVRKEALLKATSAGIAAGLDRFSVSVDASARLLDSTLADLVVGDWTLHPLDRLPGEVGALAVRGALTGVQRHDWAWH